MSPSRKRLIMAGVALTGLLFDQVTKWWALRSLGSGRSISLIGELLELRLVHNASSAFGLLGDRTIFISVASVIVLAVVIVWAWRTPSHPVIMGLVISGGLGNITDRLVRPPGLGSGRVVDFIDLSFWPTFNLADSMIVVGIALLLITGKEHEPPAPEEA